jgi:hypothetical protein
MSLTGSARQTVNGIIVKLRFRFMLLKRAYTRSEFEKIIAATKFGDVEIRENRAGLEIIVGAKIAGSHQGVAR